METKNVAYLDYEFLMKLEKAGLTEERIKKIINSPHNKDAKAMVAALGDISFAETIKTSEFFKDGYNGLFKTSFSKDFKKFFQFMLEDEFEKLTEKPEETITTSRLNDDEILEKYSDAVSSPMELVQKFHYVMTLDPNTAEGKEARNGESYFGYFRDKNGALLYVIVYWDSGLGEWRGYCYPVNDYRRDVRRFFRKTKSQS